MNLHHLRTFLEVWRTRSISHAASSLGMTQPAASGQIRALEAELGYALFRRHARGVAPTVAANELAQAIGDGLDAAEAAFERLRLRSDALRGVVHLAGPTEFMGARMPPVAASLAAEGVDLHIRLGGRDAIYRWLDEGAVELAITASEPDDPALGYRPVLEERLFVVAAPFLDLTMRPRADWPWLVYDETMPMARTYLAAACAGSRARPAMVVGSLTFLRDAAIAGAGVCVLPDYLCRPAIEDGALVIVDPDLELPGNSIFLVWRKAAMRQPRAVFARDRCLQELAR
ncbi:MAG: LysR family transcriptional regulator [Pikeienuella sp.]